MIELAINETVPRRERTLRGFFRIMDHIGMTDVSKDIIFWNNTGCSCVLAAGVLTAVFSTFFSMHSPQQPSICGADDSPLSGQIQKAVHSLFFKT